MANKEEDYDEDERESRPRVSLFTHAQSLPGKFEISLLKTFIHEVVTMGAME